MLTMFKPAHYQRLPKDNEAIVEQEYTSKELEWMYARLTKLAPDFDMTIGEMNDL